MLIFEFMCYLEDRHFFPLAVRRIMLWVTIRIGQWFMYYLEFRGFFFREGINFESKQQFSFYKSHIFEFFPIFYKKDLKNLKKI